MKNDRRLTPTFAVCINNSEYPASLELHNIYRLLPDDDAADDADFRVVDESGRDYLYPERCFVTIELPDAVAQSVLAAPRAAVREAVVNLGNNRLARECAKLDKAQEQTLADEGAASEVNGATRKHLVKD